MVGLVCNTANAQPVSQPSDAVSWPFLSRRKHYALRASQLCIALGLLVVSGCGGLPNVPPTIEVTGSVTLDSSPLTDADVIFFDGSQYTAFGKTDGTGRFELKTRFNSEVTKEGAPAREYKVTISKTVPPGGMSEDVYEAKKEALREKRKSGNIITQSDHVPPKVEMIPPAYSQASRTTLKAVVKFNQENDFSFPLTSR